MKPLLSAPPTREDIAIWDWVVERRDGQGIAYEAASITADRRDAELMRRIERRLATVRLNAGGYSRSQVVRCVCIDPIFWPPVGAWAVDITYCA